MSDTATQSSFENVNLNTVDPQGMKIPLGQSFNYQVTEAVEKTYANEKGSGSYVSFKFTIVDDPTFSGRSFYKTMFPDKEGGKNATARQLRILMDATGVAQTGDFSEFLADLVNQRATFSAPLEERQGQTAKKLEPVLWKAQPAV